MKLRTRILAILCAASMMLPLAACAENQEKPEESKADTTPAIESVEDVVEEDADFDSLFPKLTDDLPETMDLGGRTFVILSRGNEKTTKEIAVEETNGEVVNDAVYDRNLAVSERFNCNIHNELGQSGSAAVDHGPELISKVKLSVEAGDGAYDILANSNYGTTSSMISGYYLNLYDVENLNLEKEYWAQHIIENSAINGTLFGATGSLSLFLYQDMYAVFFNRDLCAEYGIYADDVYQMVFDGKWTLDKMIEMTKDIYSDENGNSEKDKDDIYGYGLQTTSSTDAYWSSCQIRMTSVDADGNIILDTDVDKLISVVDKLKDFIYNQKGVIKLTENSADETFNKNWMPYGFANDQFLFMNDWIYSCETAIFREMESDYGIIPYPKYDENQEQYYTYVHDAYTIFCILSSVEAPEEVGAVLEALACASHNLVMPAYYETALTTKYARDLNSVECLRIIFENAYLDTGWVYSINLNSFPQKVLRESVDQQVVSSSTIIAQFKKRLDKTLAKMSDDFAAAAGK